MDLVALIGRLLFVAYFVVGGTAHFRHAQGVRAYASASRVPAPAFFVAVSGAVMVLGSLMVALGLYGDAGALGIAVFLLATTPFVHRYWAFDGDRRQENRDQFLRNLTFLGGALAVYALFALAPELGYTLTEPALPLP